MRSAGRAYGIRAMSNRLRSPEGKLPILGNIAALEARLAAAEAKIEWLSGLAFAAIAREAAAEAPGPTIKALSIDTGFSESALRKWAH